MSRKQIENLYIINGLKDFKLRNTDDLMKTHGIDFKAVAGYNRLDDLNKLLYEKFILNFFNGWGLDTRATLIPKGVFYVEDKNYLVKGNPDDDYFIVAGYNVQSIDKNGIKTVLYNILLEDYKQHKILEDKSKRYLRFEYEREEHNEWLHVINENTWY